MRLRYKPSKGEVLKWLLAAWFFTLVDSRIALGQSGSMEKTPPNIVLIVIDDIGYNDLGIYGNKSHKTPSIDLLAEEGMIFTDFHSNGAVCSPTRAALMTGQYQQRSGVEHAIGFTMDEGMPLVKKTIAEYLTEAGYRCGVFGKWHLGHMSLFGPNDQGFHKSVASNNTPDYHSHISRVGELDWYEDHQLKNESGYLTDLVTGHSVNFIKETTKQPFFLFVSHIAAHFPFQGPNDPVHRTAGKVWHQSKYGQLPEGEYKRAYKDMIEAVDRSVGTIVKSLNDQGLRENTLVFITSDNGAYSWVGSNYPYRGEKGSLYEGGHRLPAIANWPGKISGGSVCSKPVMTMDLTPTFISLAGLDLKDEYGFDGIDIVETLLESKTVESRTLFWHFKNPYINSYAYAVRDDNWKLIIENGVQHLFNLELDPTESNNLADNYPNKLETLKSKYSKWVKEVMP